MKLIYFIAALLGAYSRIYLSQHFLEDILAGSIIAVATVIVIGGGLMKRRFGNRSLISYLFFKGQQKQ